MPSMENDANLSLQQEAQQRPDVDGKYRAIYGLLARMTRAILSDRELSNTHKYGQLKNFVSGFWGVMPMLAGRKDFHEFRWEDLPTLCNAYNARQVTWSENGIRHSGTQSECGKVLDELVVQMARKHFDPQCELVFDLGCGWGHRMFDIWRANEAQAAKYFGGDRSGESQELVTHVRTLFPGMDANWFRFDFLDPDFTQIPGDPRRICLFTCHAIEQVNYIGSALFDRITARFPKSQITGIHFEPITFQIAEDYQPPAYVDAGRDRYNAEQRRYNMDLYFEVKKHPKLKVVTTEQALLDLGSGNSTSLLVWQTI